MAAIQLGTGGSGVLQNVIDGIITAIYSEGTSKDKVFKSAITFYIISGMILILASSLYFIEKNNRFSRFYYSKMK